MSCFYCKHYKKEGGCNAFPERIPLIIISGELKHDRVLSGQKKDFVFDIGENPANKNIVNWGDNSLNMLPISPLATTPSPTPEK